jgi:hypothetical protein
MSEAFATQVAAIARNSRRAALISLAGGAVVAIGLGASAWQVMSLQRESQALEARIKAQRIQEATLMSRKAVLEADLQAAQDRQALAAAQIAQGKTQAAAEILAPAAAAEAPAAGPVAAAPRVYFQAQSGPRTVGYETCVKPLEAAGYRVPELVTVSTTPARNELRFFRNVDRERAGVLAGLVGRCLGEPVRLVFMGQYAKVNPGHFEVWIAERSPSQEAAG